MERPEPAEQYANRVENFFEGDEEGEEYQDHYLIKAYCNHIEVPYEEYIKLFAQTSLAPLSNLLEYDIFMDYKQDFDQSTEVKNLKKSTVFKKKTPMERSAELDQRFIAYLYAIEKDKLRYFIIAHEQGCKVLIVNVPSTDTEVEKQFLGYEWSGAKNNEGIKYNGGVTVNDIITPLFDPKDLDDDTKINTAIKQNFMGETTDPLPEHCHYAKLTDMLNFNRIKFNKIINLNPMQNIDIETQWSSVKLRKVCNLQGGNTFKVIHQGNKDKTQIPFFKVSDMNSPENSKVMTVANNYIEETVFNQQIKATLIGKSSIVFPKVGMSIYTDKKRILACDSGIDNNIMGVSVLDENKLIPLFLLEIFNQFIRLGEIASIANPPSISEDNLKEVKIPLPPLKTQQRIVDECEAIDQETDEDRQTITVAKQKIEEKVNRLWSESIKDKLDNVIWINTNTYNPIQKPDKEFIYIDIDSVGKANGVIDYSKRLTGKNAPSRARKIAKNGNTIISTVRPYLKGFAFVDTDDIDDCVFSTGFAVLESKSPQSLLDKVIYYFFMYMDELMQQMINTMGKSSYPSINEDDIKNYQFPIPPLNIQQQLVAEVEQLEAEITQAQAVIDKAIERKNDILRNYL